MNFTVNLVSQSNKELTSAESIKLIISPFFLILAVVRFLGLSGFHDCLNELINLAVLVEVVPECFSVVWVLTTSKALFTSVIEEGDTSSSKSKSECTLEKLVVAVAV